MKPSLRKTLFLSLSLSLNQLLAFQEHDRAYNTISLRLEFNRVGEPRAHLLSSRGCRK